AVLPGLPSWLASRCATSRRSRPASSGPIRCAGSLRRSPCSTGARGPARSAGSGSSELGPSRPPFGLSLAAGEDPPQRVQAGAAGVPVGDPAVEPAALRQVVAVRWAALRGALRQVLERVDHVLGVDVREPEAPHARGVDDPAAAA